MRSKSSLIAVSFAPAKRHQLRSKSRIRVSRSVKVEPVVPGFSSADMSPILDWSYAEVWDLRAAFTILRSIVGNIKK